jgi:LacI family transcriptional regulator
VCANNRLGALHATEHLIYQGYKRIAHITNSPHLSITKERLQGYKDGLEKNNRPFNDTLVKYCNHGGMIVAEIEEAVNSLYKPQIKPDAIFTASDRITTVCLDVLKRKQKREVGLIGFTNTNLGDLFLTPLSVIRQPAFEIGQNATELLIQLIESKRPVTEFETGF